MLLREIVLFIVVGVCSCIRLDYYSANEEDEQIENNFETINTTDPDEIEEFITREVLSTDESTSIHPDHESYYDDDLIVRRRVMTERAKTTIVGNNKSNVTSSRKLNISQSVKSTSNYTNKYNKTPLINLTYKNRGSLLNSYNYIYDYDDDDERSPFAFQRQGQDDFLYETTDSNNNADITIAEDVTEYDNISIKYLADFYNLIPAVNKVRFKYPLRKMNTSKYMWYVPEKYPCWELPLVYGRLGRRQVMSNVFRVYANKLTSVIDEASEEPIIPREYYVPDVDKISNKWCAVAPCYGDHSLCVFSEKSYSKICVRGYEVIKPNSFERTSIVNTMNSMRSSIASGISEQYNHLPTAANMKQILYDVDLEDMAMAWLRQCLPGLDACSSLQNAYVTQLECTKSAEYCCFKSNTGDASEPKCVPKYECFILPVVGCLYAWFASAGQKLIAVDVACGHANPDTFNTVQLIWAKTNKIGCAYGQMPNGDARVICNFAPGSSFYLDSKYLCGIIAHRDVIQDVYKNVSDVTDLKFLASQGFVLINKHYFLNESELVLEKKYNKFKRVRRTSILENLKTIYLPGAARVALKDFSNGTMGMVARLVTRYVFVDKGQSRCDLDEAIYMVGKPGSKCLERGRKYNSLCYAFAEPNPGYRLVAILAPIALFSLILFDLFSGVMRQTNY